jgi:hypothetical protein
VRVGRRTHLQGWVVIDVLGGRVVPRTMLVIEVRDLFQVIYVAAVALIFSLVATIGDAYNLRSFVRLLRNPLASS